MEVNKTHISVPTNELFSIRRTVMTPNTYKIHSHENCELNYILSGWGTRFVGDNIHSFSRGDLVLIGSGLPHCWEVKGVAKGSEPECLTIHFNENMDGELFFNSLELRPIYNLIHEAKSGIQFKNDAPDQVKDILLNMFNANRLRRFIYLLEIFEILVGSKERNTLVLPGYSNESETPEKQKLRVIYEYILSHFSEKIRLDAIADQSNITNSALCRFFKRNTGKSLFDYIKEVRIGYACKLLQDSDYAIFEIAFQSGYNNIAHFNSQFKEVCGQTPGSYRARYSEIYNS
ncbi:MAG: helix-turn-helix domain-containing protein [Cyclobacteriaceae bacterium]